MVEEEVTDNYTSVNAGSNEKVSNSNRQQSKFEEESLEEEQESVRPSGNQYEFTLGQNKKSMPNLVNSNAKLSHQPLTSITNKEEPRTVKKLHPE